MTPKTPDLESTAAELAAELARPHDATLPEHLAAQLVADGERMLGRPEVRVRELPVRGQSWRPHAGWLMAAAAAVAWLVVPSPFAARGIVPLAPAELRDSLLVDAQTLRIRWTPTGDPAGVKASGEVVWDAGTQRGVMRFAGLVPNDPKTAQYQLWIVDAERDAQYPVDGGVFDVTSSGEVLIPIVARVPVGRPTLFAVTLERPGGVVVSRRERLVLAAPVEG